MLGSDSEAVSSGVIPGLSSDIPTVSALSGAATSIVSAASASPTFELSSTAETDSPETLVVSSKDAYSSVTGAAFSDGGATVSEPVSCSEDANEGSTASASSTGLTLSIVGTIF